MKQIITSNGDKIKGLFRKPDGSLVVNDPEAYRKAILEKSREEEFEILKQKVNSMENMLASIYNKLLSEPK
jgi:hypothetical protein